MIYADDPDAHLVVTVTDALGGTLSFTPSVKVDASTTVTATWLGTVSTTNGRSTRDLDIPLTSLTAGSHTLRLVVPSDNDVPLGTVVLL